MKYDGSAMKESDLMTHLDLIEAAAKKVGLETKRANVRSLHFVQIKELNGEWCAFDPIRNGKDLAKFLWHQARSIGLHSNEQEFRTELLKEIMSHDYIVS